MKKLSLALCLVLVLSVLAACSPSANNEQSSTTPANQTTNAGETTVEGSDNPKQLEDLKGKKIAAVVLLEDQFQRMLQMSMEKAAEKYGAEVLTGHSGGELDKEVELVNTYATGGVDGMCIFPVSQTGSAAAMKNAADNGMQIYCANMDMQADWQVGFAEMDQYGIGVSVGEFAREYIQEKFPDRKPKVAIIQFKALLPEMSKQRTDGFLSKTNDLIEIVQDVDAWDSDKAVDVAAEVMNANPDLDIIFCANEGGTVGTVMAIKNAGKNIPVFGIDASEQLANMLLDPDNILQAVCGQDPIALGETAMTNLCLAMMGKPFETGIKLPGIPLTREKPDEIKAYVENLKTVLGE